MAAPDKFGLALRVGLYAFLEIVGLAISFNLLSWTGALVAAALSPFIAATLTNLFTLRIFERRPLGDIGLRWTPASLRHLGAGLGCGIGAALLVIGPALLARAATLTPAPEQPANFRSLLFVSLVLAFGAAGEEILFRGYGFQILARAIGPFATILPVAVLFAAGHANNPGANQLAGLNTFLWGALFGWCVFRSGDLWLAIGIHYGWNWTLPLFGVNLSGFTMGVTGYKLAWTAGPLWSGGEYGVEASVLTTLVVPLVAAVLWKAPLLTQRLPLVSSEEEEPVPEGG